MHRLHIFVEYVEEFENKYFGESRYLTDYNSYDIVGLEPNFLRLKTMSVDEDGCYWSLIGYIFNDIKMWVDIKS